LQQLPAGLICCPELAQLELCCCSVAHQQHLTVPQCTLQQNTTASGTQVSLQGPAVDSWACSK
jgi:hypothetical protein